MSQDLLDPQVQHAGNGNGQKALPYATAVLVLGILSIAGCILYGIPGLICGIIAIILHKKDKDLYESNPAVYELAYKNSRAGFICAIIGTIISALFFIFFIVYFFFLLSAFSMIQ
jgi:hypothetical protein